MISQNRGKLITTQRFFTNLYFNLQTIFFFFYKKRLFIACSRRSEDEYSEQKSEQEKTAKSVGVGREGRQSSTSLTVPLPTYFFCPLRLGHSQLLTYSRCFCCGNPPLTLYRSGNAWILYTSLFRKRSTY